MRQLWAVEPLVATQSGNPDLRLAYARFEEGHGIGIPPDYYVLSETGALDEQWSGSLVWRGPYTTPERVICAGAFSTALCTRGGAEAEHGYGPAVAVVDGVAHLGVDQGPVPPRRFQLLPVGTTAAGWNFYPLKERALHGELRLSS